MLYFVGPGPEGPETGPLTLVYALEGINGASRPRYPQNRLTGQGTLALLLKRAEERQKGGKAGKPASRPV